MRLQVGKKYIDDEGNIKYVAGYSSVTDLFWDEKGGVYYPNGVGTLSNDVDLVEEYIAPISEEVSKEAFNDWCVSQSKYTLLSTWNAAIEWYKTQI